MNPDEAEVHRLATRRRRLSDVFGEVLPDVVRDDTDDGAAAESREADLAREVPPHHGS